VAALGERLFLDQRLSADGKVSCATCHAPDKAFTDALPVAVGLGERKGTRNSPTLLNVTDHDAFFWDGRRATLEEQVLDPFLNPAEHGQSQRRSRPTFDRSHRVRRGSTARPTMTRAR
jgi:cytochrome c peroxidase